MNRPGSAPAEVSLVPDEGWHCSHLYYTFNRGTLHAHSVEDRRSGCDEIAAILDPSRGDAPARMQTVVVSGQKADFGLMLMDPDPLKIDSIDQQLRSSSIGPALEPAYSFVSMTEISEYVPSVEQYEERLVREGDARDSPTFAAKSKAYAARLPAMNRQRLTPEFPPWPATCFYPMNKSRVVGANWFTLPFSDRNRMMSEHARSGMAFAGKVSQLISTGVGLEDWEWGVTLWACNPQHLREIVYRMRFDEASAKYAEFGPFYTGYVVAPEKMLEHCRVAG